MLDGDALELVAVEIDGAALGPERYTLDGAHLTIASVPERFTLRVATRLSPDGNTTLMGLYVSNGNFFMYSPRRRASGASRSSRTDPT